MVKTRFSPGRGLVPDDRARSLSFLATSPALLVDDSLLGELRETSAANGGCDARICLHGGSSALFHEMIILQHRGGYYRPHRHLTKGESCHVLEGAAALIVFDDAGGISQCFPVGARRGRLARVGEGQWHTVLPLTASTIYHEAKPGPFLGPDDSVYPAWAPPPADESAARAYLARLYRSIEELTSCAP